MEGGSTPSTFIALIHCVSGGWGCPKVEGGSPPTPWSIKMQGSTPLHSSTLRHLTMPKVEEGRSPHILIDQNAGGYPHGAKKRGMYLHILLNSGTSHQLHSTYRLGIKATNLLQTEVGVRRWVNCLLFEYVLLLTVLTVFKCHFNVYVC